jgi:hypothetical protein
MKIRMLNSYSITEVYDTIEIDPNEYDELRGLSEEEVLQYLDDNGYDFCLKDGNEENIVDEFRFNREIVREKTTDEEQKFLIVE